MDTADLYHKGGNKQSSMFLHCLWRSQIVNCDGLLTETITTSGRCFTFNSAEYIKKHGRFNSSLIGTQYGLRIAVLLNQNEYTLLGDALQAGIQVRIGSKNNAF